MLIENAVFTAKISKNLDFANFGEWQTIIARAESVGMSQLSAHFLCKHCLIRTVCLSQSRCVLYCKFERITAFFDFKKKNAKINQKRLTNEFEYDILILT